MIKRILVVEDNPDNRILITDVLSSMDYEVLVAVDGEEGLALAENEAPDLILMDLSLPKIDGWTATHRIKAQERLRHIPILALTAHAMVGDREKALEAGCDDYISKPIDLRELSSKLAHFLGPDPKSIKAGAPASVSHESGSDPPPAASASALPATSAPQASPAPPATQATPATPATPTETPAAPPTATPATPAPSTATPAAPERSEHSDRSKHSEHSERSDPNDKHEAGGLSPIPGG